MFTSVAREVLGTYAEVVADAGSTVHTRGAATAVCHCNVGHDRTRYCKHKITLSRGITLESEQMSLFNSKLIKL